MAGTCEFCGEPLYEGHSHVVFIEHDLPDWPGIDALVEQWKRNGGIGRSGATKSPAPHPAPDRHHRPRQHRRR